MGSVTTGVEEEADAADAAAAAIATIRAQALESSRARTAVLEDAVAALIEGRLDAATRRDAEREAHRLAGSAGTFGYLAASESARRLEHILAGSAPVPVAQILAAAEAVVSLRAELEGEPTPGPPADRTSPLLPDTAEPPAHPDIGDGPTPRLLVVALGGQRRRDRRHREDVTSTAAARGFQVHVVDDAAHAVDAAPAVRAAPAVAVVDLDMPGGARLVRHLTSAAPPVPTLALVVDTFAASLEAARSGARRSLTRAARPEELVDAVEGLLERTRIADATVLTMCGTDMRDEIRGSLVPAGVRVIDLAAPAALWSTPEHVPADLLIVDLDSTGRGTDLCRAVRHDLRRCALPIVALTSDGGVETTRAALAAGADDVLTTPFTGAELLDRVRTRLERTRTIAAAAGTDPVTGLAAPARADHELQMLRALAERQEQPLSVAVVTVESHGEAAGDQTAATVLRRVASSLRSSFDGADVVARLGGQEFVVGMYGTSREDGTRHLASFLELAASRTVADGARQSATLRAGLAAYPADGTTVDELCRRARQAGARAERTDRARPPGRLRRSHAQPTSAPGAPAYDADVVLVEDDETLVQLLGHTLGVRGYRWRHLADGQQAADQLAGSPTALRTRVLLLDVDLPGLDGLGVLRRMAASGGLDGTRVIMLTARSREAEVVAAFELGAFDHVGKPFSVPVLMQRIQRALDE